MTSHDHSSHAPEADHEPAGDQADQAERYASMLAEVFGEDDPLASGDCGAMLERLYLFLDGELTDERRALIVEHLDSCNTCLGAFDFEAELRLVVRERINTRVPNDLVERLRRSLREAVGQADTGHGPAGHGSSSHDHERTE